MKKNLQLHVQKLHLEKNFACQFCFKKFGTAYSRHVHETQVHLKNFPCPKCDQMFDRKERLRTHVKKIHYEDVSF